MLKVVSSNPGTIYWMDIFTCICFCKNFNVFEKTKMNEKEAGVGPFFLIVFNKMALKVSR